MSAPVRWAALVPELTCTDLPRSLDFYCNVLGWTLAFERECFAYLVLGEAQLMLEQGPSGWETGEMTQPFGRGINLQIEVGDLSLIERSLAEAGHPIFRPPAERWYRAEEVEHGQAELLVQDPDGYLLRFVTILGERPVANA